VNPLELTLPGPSLTLNDQLAPTRQDQLELTFLVAAFKYDQLGKIKQVVSRRHMLGLAFKYDPI